MLTYVSTNTNVGTSASATMDVSTPDPMFTNIDVAIPVIAAPIPATTNMILITVTAILATTSP